MSIGEASPPPQLADMANKNILINNITIVLIPINVSPQKVLNLTITPSHTTSRIRFLFSAD